MKKYKNLSILAGIVLLFAACEDGEEVFDDIRSNELRGAILRTVNFDTNEIPIGSSDYSLDVDLEIQDQENGTLVDNIEVFLSFTDNTIETGNPDLSGSEVMIGTIPSSEFTIGEFGFPRTSYSVPLSTLLSTFGLQLSDIFVTGGDQFTIRFELVLNDGRRYSLADNSGTLTQAFFSSPFQYTTTVVCPALAPTPGTYTIAMQDSFGDGWNGASLDITVDDELSTFLVDGGSESTQTLEIPEGAESISIIFNSGDFDEEITYQITSSTGTVLFDVGPGPFDLVGVELIDYCDLSIDL